MQRRFLLDTASLKDTENILGNINLSDFTFLGNTTNPRIFEKEGLYKLSEWENRIRELVSLYSTLGMDEVGIHIQFPNSHLTYYELLEFIHIVKGWVGNKVKLTIKIPHYYYCLTYIPGFQFDKFANEIDFNVTGITDALTATRAFQWGAKYASLLLGRMIERNIPPYEHLEFLQTIRKPITQEIISGSMRTIDSLCVAIQFGTLPTIGPKVFYDMFQEQRVENFKHAYDYSRLPNNVTWTPIIEARNLVLSKEFFNQMDECGKTAFDDFNTIVSQNATNRESTTPN